MRYTTASFLEQARRRLIEVSTERALLQEGKLSAALQAQEHALREWLCISPKAKKAEVLKMLGRHIGHNQTGALAAELRSFAHSGVSTSAPGGVCSIDEARAKIAELAAISPQDVAVARASALLDKCAAAGLQQVSLRKLLWLGDRTARGFVL
jgi:hypothetical protein